MFHMNTLTKSIAFCAVSVCGTTGVSPAHAQSLQNEVQSQPNRIVSKGDTAKLKQGGAVIDGTVMMNKNDLINGVPVSGPVMMNKNDLINGMSVSPPVMMNKNDLINCGKQCKGAKTNDGAMMKNNVDLYNKDLLNVDKEKSRPGA